MSKTKQIESLRGERQIKIPAIKIGQKDSPKHDDDDVNIQ